MNTPSGILLSLGLEVGRVVGKFDNLLMLMQCCFTGDLGIMTHTETSMRVFCSDEGARGHWFCLMLLYDAGLGPFQMRKPWVLGVALQGYWLFSSEDFHNTSCQPSSALREQLRELILIILSDVSSGFGNKLANIIARQNSSLAYCGRRCMP